MTFTGTHLIFVLVLALPLLGAGLALVLRRFVREHVVMILAAIPLFLAGVGVIILVQILSPSEELGQAIPVPETPANVLQQAPTARWVQPPRTLPVTATLSMGQTPTTPTPEPTPAPTINPLSEVTVAVRNGTGGSGVASRTAEMLEAEGFRVVEVENDRKVGERPHTLILDKGDHPEVRQMLTDLLNVEPEYVETHSDEPGEADFIVILGDDYED